MTWNDLPGVIVAAAVVLASACVRPLAAEPTPTPQPISTPVPPTATPAPTFTPVPTPTPVPVGTGPLSASGAKLVDAGGREVRLTGVNWSGMETSAFAPVGVSARNLDDMLDQIVAAGFNTLRLPFSNQFLDPTVKPMSINFAINPRLSGLTGLELLDYIVNGARQRGLRVILDRHRPNANGQVELWYTAQVPEERWIQDWVMLARQRRGTSAGASEPARTPGVFRARLRARGVGPIVVACGGLPQQSARRVGQSLGVPATARYRAGAGW